MMDLRERILSGSGPDREIDALVWCALHPPRSTDDGEDLIVFRPTRKSDECAPGTYWRVSCSGMSLQTAPPFTASVDACLRLMGEVLPDWVIYSTTNCDVYSAWRVERADKYSVELKGTKPMTGRPYAQGEHEDLPRALLAALLDAKAQEAG